MWRREITSKSRLSWAETRSSRRLIWCARWKARSTSSRLESTPKKLRSRAARPTASCLRLKRHIPLRDRPHQRAEGWTSAGVENNAHQVAHSYCRLAAGGYSGGSHTGDADRRTGEPAAGPAPRTRVELENP